MGLRREARALGEQNREPIACGPVGGGPSHNNQVPPPLATLAPVEHGPDHLGRVDVQVVPPTVGKSYAFCGGPRRHLENVIGHRHDHSSVRCAGL